MSDVKPGPLEGSERLICWSWAPGDVKMFDVKPGPLDGSKCFMLSLGPLMGQNKPGPLGESKCLMLSLGP